MKERKNTRGFSLLELMVAMAVFLVIGGVTLGLFAQHAPLFNRQQDQAALNIQIRNSIMQLQTDVVNGGSGYITGTNLPSGVVGVTIVNSNPAVACNTPATFIYSSTCFDTLNVINIQQTFLLLQPTVPILAAHPDNGTFAANYSTTETDCVTSNSGAIWVYPVVPVTSPVTTQAQAAAALAADYASAYTSSAEKEFLLVNAAGTKMTTIMLTAAPAVSIKNGVSAMQLAFTVTNAGGTNAAANDPLNISVLGNGNPMVSSGYCSSDYVLQLAPITYTVSTLTPTNPQLVRTQGGVSSVLAQQVIGFKVGAILWNAACPSEGITGAGSDDDSSYCYDSSTAGYSSQWTTIRSVQISLIGRTNPNPGASYTYRNSFDSGPYQIEGVMAVLNPRNMSMNDADF
jgi:prepilin-type N-terminal cleavage/methylation domain-containing protein